MTNLYLILGNVIGPRMAHIYQKQGSNLVCVFDGTADRLKEARTVTLDGAVTGQASFDGSQNITITTEMAGNGLTASTLEVPTPIAANTYIQVPEYTVGAGNLQVFVDGAICRRSVQYSESGTAGNPGTRFLFKEDIPAGHEVEVVVWGSTTCTHGSKPGPISAGYAFVVPEYVVGSNSVCVYLNGVRCVLGKHYDEHGEYGESSNRIKFFDAIPAGYEVYVQVMHRAE